MLLHFNPPWSRQSHTSIEIAGNTVVLFSAKQTGMMIHRHFASSHA